MGMSAANKRAGVEGSAVRSGKYTPVPGLPHINYRGPLLFALGTSLILLFVLIAMGIITGATGYTQMSRSLAGDANTSLVFGGMCGLVSLASLVAVGFLVTVLVKVVRDLQGRPIYARGEVLDKRSIGGRNIGNWLAVGVSYIGPDKEEASHLTAAQRNADRSLRFQPRFSRTSAPIPPPPTVGKRIEPLPGSYLPPERVLVGKEAAKEAEEEEKANRVVFRVDPASFGVLETGDEVIVAHSRFLEHIYYVAHLRGGEWESYRNHQLI
jgi:hypothetical protein